MTVVSRRGGRCVGVGRRMVGSGRGDAPASRWGAGASDSRCSGSRVADEGFAAGADQEVPGAGVPLGVPDGVGFGGAPVVADPSAVGAGGDEAVSARRHASTVNHGGHAVNTISGVFR